MSKLKKITMLLLLAITVFTLTACGGNDGSAIEEELRAELEGTWMVWVSLDELIMLNFPDNWRNDETALTHDVAITMSQPGDDGPSINFLYMRFYTEEDPVIVTIYGHDVHDREVNIFDEEPLTIRGDVLHLGEMRFYREDSDALNDHMMDIVTGGN